MNIKTSLVQYYRWLRQYGLNDSHSGNASLRDGDIFWITPTGACADTLTETDLVACHLDGTIGDGASLDARLHLAVYRKKPQSTAIIHSHGAHSVAMTMNGEDFRPVDFEGQYYFTHIPVITIPYADYIDKSPEAVSDVLKDFPVTVVRGHGVYTCAESINLAYKWTCSFELSARTAWLAKTVGTI